MRFVIVIVIVIDDECPNLDRVKYAVNVETGEPVAVKVVDKDQIEQSDLKNQIKKEVGVESGCVVLRR